MMRFRITLILLALNIAIFGLLYHLEQRADVRREYQQQERQVLKPGLVAGIQRITMSGTALEQSWVLEKQRDKWQLVEPVNWRANPYAISNILSQLEMLEWDTAFTLQDIQKSGQTLLDFGLETPSATITLSSADGLATDIKIGEATQIGQRLYIMPSNQERVFVVKRSLLDSLALSLDDLRDARLFDQMLFELDTLSISAGTAKTTLNKSNNGWNFQVPIQAEADPRAVEAALAGLTGIQVLQFVGTSEVQTGLSNPSYEILIGGANRRQTLLIGNPVKMAQTDAYFARLQNNSTPIIIPAAPIDFIIKAQETLRERRFFKFGESSQLSSIQLVSPEATTQLQRLEDGQWQLLYQDPGDGLRQYPADPTIIEKTILTLKNIRAEYFYSDAPSDEDLTSYGLINAPRRIVVKNGLTETLLIGRSEAGEGLLYTREPEARFVYQIRPESLYPIPFEPSYYRLRTVNALPVGASLAAIKLEDIQTGTVLIEQSFQQGLSSVEEYLKSVEDKAGQDAIRAIIEAAQNFPVKLYIGKYFKENSMDTPGLSYPWHLKLTVKANLPGGDGGATQEDVYYFTRRIGGASQYGGHNRSGEVFFLPQHLIDALEQLAPNQPVPSRSEVEAQLGILEQTQLNLPQPDSEQPAEQTPDTINEPAAETEPAAEPAAEPGARTEADKSPTTPASTAKPVQDDTQLPADYLRGEDTKTQAAAQSEAKSAAQSAAKSANAAPAQSSQTMPLTGNRRTPRDIPPDAAETPVPKDKQ